MISFVVPFRGDGSGPRSDSWSWNRARLLLLYPDAQVVTVDADSGAPFNRSRSRNLGAHYEAIGEVLVFLDADTVFVDSAFRQGLEALEEYDWVLPYAHYYDLTERFTARQLEQAPQDELLPRPEYVHKFPSAETPEPAISGCVIVKRTVFNELGGYNENFQGWGLEDRVLAMKLRHYFDGVRIGAFVYHLWHPTPEEERFGQPHFEENRRLYREECGLLGLHPIC